MSPAELAVILRERGVTHVFINWDHVPFMDNYYDHLKNADWQLIREFLRDHTALVFASPVAASGEAPDAKHGEQVYELHQLK